jgi:transcriptional regulator with XRE-family HTH domain
MKLDISKQLSKLMRDNNLSQSALSRATGVPQPTINRILSEVTREPRRDSVVRIANFSVSLQSHFMSLVVLKQPELLQQRQSKKYTSG